MSVHFCSFLAGVLCCTEQDVPIPTVPIIFNKLPSCIVRDGANIVKPSMTKKLDFDEKQKEWKKNGQWHVEVY